MQQLNYLFLSVLALPTLENFLSTAYESSASTTRKNKIYVWKYFIQKLFHFTALTADYSLEYILHNYFFINKTA